MKDQLEFEKSSEVVITQPSMTRYSLHIDKTDVYCEVTHAEVLGDMFNIGRVLEAMRGAGKMDTTQH